MLKGGALKDKDSWSVANILFSAMAPPILIEILVAFGINRNFYLYFFTYTLIIVLVFFGGKVIK